MDRHRPSPITLLVLMMMLSASMRLTNNSASIPVVTGFLQRSSSSSILRKGRGRIQHHPARTSVFRRTVAGSSSSSSLATSYLDSLGANEKKVGTATSSSSPCAPPSPQQGAPSSITFSASPFAAVAKMFQSPSSAVTAPPPSSRVFSTATVGATMTFPGQTTSATAGFQYVPVLSLAHADTIASQVVTVCQRNAFQPVVVVVLDASGQIICSQRMDGCAPVGSADMAYAKAYSCIVNRYPSRQFRDRYTATNESSKFCQMLAMNTISGNQMAPFPGGIVLQHTDTNEYVIGAVGVSGAAGDEDEYCALQAVHEAKIPGLTTLPLTHSCSTIQD